MIFQKKLIESLKANAERTAIEYEERHVSYSGLFDASTKVTDFLLRLQVGRETVIGICLQDRVDVITAMIGVVNARCVFVPVDGALPAYRLAAMISELGLNYIISSATQDLNNLKASAPSLQYCFIEDILSGTVSVNEPLMPYPEYEENDSIYIYFTSGSTGKPKGIIGRNSSLLQFIEWELSAFDIGPECRFSQFISPYFDAFLRDVFVPILSGGTVCIPPAGRDFFLPEKIVAWVDSQKINVIHCVPSLFRLLNAEGLSQDLFPSLKYVLLSGEKIIPSELVNWYNVFNDRIQLVNLYGPTETTMIRAYYKIQPADAHQTRIPIGYPIAGTALLVAKPDLKPCDALIPGELYIISDYVTKGYLNDPVLNRERFIKIDPGTPEETTAFKTGDLARRLTDGRIDLIGRIDRQIKVRGIRVEPDEIENVLCALEFIKNAVVMKDETGTNEVLAAFVIRRPGSAPEINLQQELRLHLEKYLPEYMIPSAIIEVNEYPLLSSGKIDYKELLKHLPEEVIQPADEIESGILAIWKEILGDNPISTEASFYKLGGNSLNMMRLISRVYKSFNVRIPLNELLNNDTIKKQAAFVRLSGKDQLLNIPKAAVKPAYSLSANQQRIYFNFSLNKESTSFNLPMVWEIKGAVDKHHLEGILQQLIERHESLRTAFKTMDGKLQQVITDVDFHIEDICCPDLPASQAIADFIRPFDLGTAPLIRCGLITAMEDKRIFVVDIHHIICDGWSQAILFSDFLKLYKGLPLNPLPIQYKDYAEWEYGFRRTEQYMAQREFWLRSFETGIPRLNWPTINKNEKGIWESGGSVSFKIDPDTVIPLKKALEKEQITTFSGLFACFFIFLLQLTGDEDIVVGTNTAGRMQHETEGVTGMFAKTLPVRRQLDVNMPFMEFAKDMHTYLSEAFSRQMYDLSDIVNALNRNAAAPVESMFDVMFVLHDFENDQPGDIATFARYEYEHSTSKYPMTLFVSETPAALEFRMEYSAAYFTGSDVELIIGQFRDLVIKISENPGSRMIEYISNNIVPSHFMDDDITFNF